ncbi:papain family cysteine protease [Ostertagia ostertagi]
MGAGCASWHFRYLQSHSFSSIALSLATKGLAQCDVFVPHAIMRFVVVAAFVFATASAAFIPPSKRVLREAEQLTGLELIEYVNKAQNLFTAKLSPRFAQYPDDIKKRLMGSKHVAVPEEFRVNEKTHDDIEDASIPDSFDARKQWPQCPSILSIRDQSTCGSCWAFGAAEAMTDRICIASNGKEQFTISADDILSCCGFMCGSGCEGGFAIQAWKFWVKHGVVTGGNYTSKAGCKPYPFPPCEHDNNATRYKPCPSDIVPTNTCEHSCQTGYSTSYTDDKHFGECLVKRSRSFPVHRSRRYRKH